jgi:hypothetical protein
MIERDIYLVLVGGLIGLVSSLATIFLTYALDGMRLRRQWEREDQRLMQDKRSELEQLLKQASPPDPNPADIDPETAT